MVKGNGGTGRRTLSEIENFLSMKYKIDADDRIHELTYGCEPKAV